MICYKCRQDKDIEEFSPSQRGWDHRYCKVCRHNEWKLRGKIPSSTRRKWMLKSRYGITPEQFNEMSDLQNNECAICFKQLFNKAHIDHNHSTGKVRGLLCAGCNIRLSQIENPVLLKASLTYLQLHNSCNV